MKKLWTIKVTSEKLEFFREREGWRLKMALFQQGPLSTPESVARVGWYRDSFSSSATIMESTHRFEHVQAVKNMFRYSNVGEWITLSHEGNETMTKIVLKGKYISPLSIKKVTTTEVFSGGGVRHLRQVWIQNKCLLLYIFFVLIIFMYKYYFIELYMFGLYFKFMKYWIY